MISYSVRDSEVPTIIVIISDAGMIGFVSLVRKSQSKSRHFMQMTFYFLNQK